jgi:hypothetical protein
MNVFKPSETDDKNGATHILVHESSPIQVKGEKKNLPC